MVSLNKKEGDYSMSSVISAVRDTVPITQFNRGLAGKIFEEVKASGAKVVMKNNVAECVLLSPDEYVHIMEELENAELLALANERLARAESKDYIPQEEFWNEFGITQKDLDAVGEVEFE